MAVTKTYAIQQILLSPAPTAGTFALTFGSDSPLTQNYNDPAATLQTAVQGSASIGSGNAAVAGEADLGAIYITFIGSLAQMAVPLVAVDASGLTGQGTIGAVTETTPGSTTPGTSTVVQFTFDSSGNLFGPPAGGNYNVNSAGGISYDSTPANDANWSYSGSAQAGTLTATSLTHGDFSESLPTIDGNGLTDASTSGWISNGGVITQTSLTPGTPDAGTAEVQSIPAPTASGGTFLVTGTAEPTSALAYNAAAADVQTALNALSDITTAGGVVVSGPDGGPWPITWNDPGPQALLTTDGTSLTGPVTATPSDLQVGGQTIGGVGGGGRQARFLLKLVP